MTTQWGKSKTRKKFRCGTSANMARTADARTRVFGIEARTLRASFAKEVERR